MNDELKSLLRSIESVLKDGAFSEEDKHDFLDALYDRLAEEDEEYTDEERELSLSGHESDRAVESRRRDRVNSDPLVMRVKEAVAEIWPLSVNRLVRLAEGSPAKARKRSGPTVEALLKLVGRD